MGPVFIRPTVGLAAMLAFAGWAQVAQAAACYQVLQLGEGVTATLNARLKEEIEFELTVPFGEASVTVAGTALDGHNPPPSPPYALRITGAFSHYAQHDPDLVITRIVVQAPSYAAKGALLPTAFDAAVAAAGATAIPARPASTFLDKRTVVELFDEQGPRNRVGRLNQARVLAALAASPELGVAVGTKAGGDAGPKVTFKVATTNLAERMLKTVEAVQQMQKRASAGQCTVPGAGLAN